MMGQSHGSVIQRAVPGMRDEAQFRQAKDITAEGLEHLMNT